MRDILSKDDLIVVTGAGGFIGGHLIADLRASGCRRLRAVDIKPTDDWYQRFEDVENLRLDLKENDACRRAARDARYVFNLAADMGGMGFIEAHKADCMLSVLIFSTISGNENPLNIRSKINPTSSRSTM